MYEIFFTNKNGDKLKREFNFQKDIASFLNCSTYVVNRKINGKQNKRYSMLKEVDIIRKGLPQSVFDKLEERKGD